MRSGHSLREIILSLCDASEKRAPSKGNPAKARAPSDVCTITAHTMPVMCTNIAIQRVLLIAKQVPRQLKTPSAIAPAQLFGGILPHGHSLHEHPI